MSICSLITIFALFDLRQSQYEWLYCQLVRWAPGSIGLSFHQEAVRYPEKADEAR